MAQSTLKHPQTVMSELKRDYQMTNEEEILAFLERHPAVAPILPDIRSNIRRFFGEDPVRLDVFHDPEWPQDDPKLVLNVLTELEPKEALARLHRFDDEWWITQVSESRSPLIVSILLVRHV
jgi:16S rRNA C967 or C1407 C5-methylase (RsmB/RsmF family)